MKKLKSFILLVACLLSAGIFFACDNSVNGKVEFSATEIEIVKGESFDLDKILKVEGATFDDVKFASSDKTVACVTPDYKIGGVNVGTALISAECGKTNSTVTVNVLNEIVYLDSPLGLRYDLIQGAVVWNEVYSKIDGQIFTANSYTVWIQKDGQEPVEHNNILTPKFVIEDEGTYTIKVKTNDRSSVIRGSSYSDSIVVKKLAKPTNVILNNETSVLSWESNATEFAVCVNGVRTNTTNKSYPLNLSSAGQYEISVIALDSSSSVIEAESDKIVVTRLASPVVSCENGRVAWNRQNGVDYYQVIISSELNPDEYRRVDGDKSSYTLEGLTKGTYSVRVIAYPKNNYLMSSSSNEVEVTKLAAPTIQFNEASREISVVDTLDNSVEFTVEKQNGEKNTFIVQAANNYKFAWSETQATTYRISAKVIAKSGQIVSDESNIITITQLAKAQGVTHLVSGEKSLLDFDAVASANHYEIEIDGEGIKTIENFANEPIELGLTNSLFSEAKQYIIKLIASSTESSTTRYILSSEQNITVTRLSNVTNLAYDDIAKVITWNNVSGKSNYQYSITKDGTTYADDVFTDIVSLNVSSYGFGNYEFKIKALGNGENTLDSLDYASVTFELEGDIESPVLSFDRENKTLSVSEVENANEYEIKLDGERILLLSKTQLQDIDVSSYFTEEKVYTFTVIARNTQNDLLVDSIVTSSSTVQVEKLKRPTSISVSTNEIVTVADYEDQTKLDSTKYSLVINDENTNELDEKLVFEVQAKYNGKTTSNGNKYFLDSDVTTWTINRLATPKKAVFENQNISWERVDSSANYECLILISQDNVKFSINMQAQTTIEATSSLIASRIDVSKPYNISVQYRVGKTDISSNGYISSLFSETLIVQRLALVENLKVIGTEDNIEIKWDAVENSNTYILTITKPDGQKEDPITLNTTSYTSFNFAEEGRYTVQVEAKNPEYINPTAATTVYVERLAAPASVNVSLDETVTINSTPASSKLSEILVEINAGSGKQKIENAINFSEIEGNFDLFITYKAVQSEADEFYLSSGTSKWEFNRISPMNAVTVLDGQISWSTTEEADGYSLKFSKLGKEAEYILINDKLVGNIRFDDDNVKSILDSFGSGETSISIRAIKNAINSLSPGVVGYLSCSEYSTTATLTKLSAPTNVKISASENDKVQSSLTITFDYEQMDKVDNFEVYVNGRLEKTITGQKSCVIQDAFTRSGEYYLQVKAIGSGSNISSDLSTVVTFKRLTIPSQLSVNKLAQLSWQNIADSVSYILYYTLPGGVEQEIEVVNPFDLTDILKDNEDKHDGMTLVKIRAVGNGTTTFSSSASTSYNVITLAKPEIKLATETYSIVGTYDDTYKAKAVVTIKKKVGEDYEVILNKKEILLNTDASYGEGLEAGDYLIEAYTISENVNGYVNSAVVTKEFTKLPISSELYFSREVMENNSTKLALNVLKVENATYYSLSVDNLIGGKVEDNSTHIKFTDINEIIEQLEAGNKEFKVKAIGGEKDGVYYITSNYAKISAKILPQIQGLKATKGKLGWTENEYATAYKLLVNGVYEDITVADDIESVLEEYPGELLLNVRAIGNVESKTTENVILDGAFNGKFVSGTFELENYTATKLKTPTYFAVNEGYLATVKEANTTNYNFLIDGTLFDDVSIVDEEVIGESTYSLLISDRMYATLDLDKSYSISLRASTTKDDIINSNYTQAIKIKIPTGVSEVEWKLREKFNSDDDKYYYDLTDTYLTWEDKETGNGYLLKLNNKISNTSINEWTPNEDIKQGKFTLAIAVRGGSSVDGEGAYLLNSTFTNAHTYHVIGETTISVKEGVLSWKRVEDATGYYVYLNGNVYNNEAITTTSLNITTPNEYVIEVQAVSTVKDYFAGAKARYTEGEGEEETDIIVTKLGAPKKFSIENGRLYWTEGFDSLNGKTILDFSEFLNYSEEEIMEEFSKMTFTKVPFTHDLTDITEHKLILQFSSVGSSSSYSIEREAIEFLSPTESQISLIETLVSYVGMEDFYAELSAYLRDPSGWPTNIIMFDEYASKIPSGEYNLTVRQNGNDYDYLNSVYNTDLNLYVPGAPKINITYEGGEYFLNWNSVTIPEKFRTGSTKYTILGDKDEKNKQIIIAKDITDTKCNLSALIESGVLNKEFKKIYVVVQGNNTNILNGKTSAKIDIEVLTEISARVNQGVIEWDSQASASAYEIIYTGGKDNKTNTLTTPLNSWIGEELEESYTYLDVTIRALGTQYIAKEKVVLAGPVTNIGTITKLVQPTWYIENGIVKWNDIENSSSYSAKYYKTLEFDSTTKEDGIDKITKDGEVISYISNYSGNASYLLKTIGTTQLQLGEDVECFVNSNFANPLYSYKHDKIDGITCENGELVWNGVKYNNQPIKNYLLTFKRSGVADIIVDMQNLQTFKYDGYSVKYSYDGKEYQYLIADEYDLYIQAYAKGNSKTSSSQDSNFYVKDGDKTVYVLQSLIQSSGTYINKLASPLSLSVYSGKVVWEDPTSTKDSVFELSFTSSTGGVTKVTNKDESRKEEFEFNDGVWTWSGSVDLDLTNFDAKDYTLKVRRLATTSSQLNSNYVEYRTLIESGDGYVSGDLITITQLNAIRDEFVQISLIDISGIDKYVITWDSYSPAGIEDSQVSYLFEYYTKLSTSTSDDYEVKQILVNNGNKYVVYEELEQKQGTDLLIYRVRVISGRGETKLNNYLNSRWTKEFSIEKPKSVEQIYYNTTSQMYEWEYTNSDDNQNLEFIIKDYYIPNGEIVVVGADMDMYDEYKSTYYMDVKTGKNSYTFAPLKVGTHVISIEVSITNASSTDATAFKSGAILYMNEEEAVARHSEVFNLFASGEGTSVNPYIISNEKQFNNIRYRKEMLSYLSYPLVFKQNAHITLNASITAGTEGTVYKGFIDGEFNSLYNGDYYQLNVVTTLTDLNTNGGLFAKIGQKGEIENVHLLVTLSSSSVLSQLSFGLLTKENYGNIENCLIGDKVSIKTITISNVNATAQISSLVNKNYGTISLCENFYNYFVTDDGVNNFSVINIGGLVYENSALISNCGNRGSISVGSSAVIGAREGALVGGIVAKQTSTGGVSNCFNRGEITISYSSDNRTYYVGGIIGAIESTTSAGNLTNCYSYGLINVYHNNTNPSAVNIGGLVGRSRDAKYINNSYSNVTLNVQASSGITITAVICTIVGYTEINNGNNLTCYSLLSEGLAGGSGLVTYTTRTLAIAVSAMNEYDGVSSDTFDEDAINNPKFVWENSFDSIVWKV